MPMATGVADSLSEFPLERVCPPNGLLSFTTQRYDAYQIPAGRTLIGRHLRRPNVGNELRANETWPLLKGPTEGYGPKTWN